MEFTPQSGSVACTCKQMKKIDYQKFIKERKIISQRKKQLCLIFFLNVSETGYCETERKRGPPFIMHAMTNFRGGPIFFFLDVPNSRRMDSQLWLFMGCSTMIPLI